MLRSCSVKRGEEERSQRRKVQKLERERTHPDTVGDEGDRGADSLLSPPCDITRQERPGEKEREHRRDRHLTRAKKRGRKSQRGKVDEGNQPIWR